MATATRQPQKIAVVTGRRVRVVDADPPLADTKPLQPDKPDPRYVNVGGQVWRRETWEARQKQIKTIHVRQELRRQEGLNAKGLETLQPCHPLRRTQRQERQWARYGTRQHGLSREIEVPF